MVYVYGVFGTASKEASTYIFSSFCLEWNSCKCNAFFSVRDRDRNIFLGPAFFTFIPEVYSRELIYVTNCRRLSALVQFIYKIKHDIKKACSTRAWRRAWQNTLRDTIITIYIESWNAFDFGKTEVLVTTVTVLLLLFLLVQGKSIRIHQR